MRNDILGDRDEAIEDVLSNEGTFLQAFPHDIQLSTLLGFSSNKHDEQFHILIIFNKILFFNGTELLGREISQSDESIFRYKPIRREDGIRGSESCFEKKGLLKRRVSLTLRLKY